MKNYESSLGPDWWGRLTAFGSLLVAGAALWYATVELPRKMAAQPADTERTSVDAELAKQLQRKIDEATSQGERVEVVLGRMESLHADVTQLASAVEERLDQYARSSEPAADPLSETAAGLASEGVNEAMDALETSPAMAGSDASLAPADLLAPPDDNSEMSPAGERTDSTVADLAETSLTDGGLPARVANLLVVHTTMRPLQGDEKSDVTVTLKNEGDGPAVIDRVTFEPLEIMEGIPTEKVVQPLGDSTPWRLVCLFDPSENLSSDEGAEGRYVHRLGKPFSIPPGREVNVVVGIHKAAHIGYALRGRLKLEFNEGEALLVENTGIAFMGRPQP